MDKRSLYFQTIARRFFELRGAPFFLSSKELTLIEKWETAEIPLRVVLEGIQRSFLSRKSKPGRRAKVLSLAFCEPNVKEAFVLYREKTVGRRNKAAVKKNKKMDIQAAVIRFLERVPNQVSGLEALFVCVRKMLPVWSEDDLEKAEDEIETFLLSNASPEEKEEARRGVRADFPEADNEEFQRIVRIKLIKLMRDKYKIPHVAPFYY